MTLVTVKGQLEHNIEKRIQLFDGRFDTGYVVKEFWLYPNTGIGAGNDAHGVLSLESGVVANGLSWDWSSNYQIGWAAGVFGGGTSHSDHDGNGIIDPENLIIEDLYIIAAHSASGTTGYMITLEKVDLSEAAGALAMVRNKSQGSDATGPENQ